MSYITFPYVDPHPGRCKNHREGQRCLDYDTPKHICEFEEKPSLSFYEQVIGSSFFVKELKPEPWIKPC